LHGRKTIYRNQKCKWLQEHPLLQLNLVVATKKRA